MAKQKEINRKFKTVFFDYDGTLFDTTEAEKFSVRDKGLSRFSPEWVQARKVYLAHIRESKPYEGWQEVFEFIVENNIQAAIVSGNGSQVLNISVKQNNLKSVFPKAKINRIGGISKKDGNPTLFEHALKLLGEDPQNVIAFGNQLCDAQAADNAGIQAVHCIWGAKAEEREQMLTDKNHQCITSPHQIIAILRSETNSQIHAT
jgi:phosphoglycolate phosphatase